MRYIEPTDYHYEAFWSNEDNAFVGFCLEFPSLSWIEPAHPTAALMGIRKLVETVIQDDPGLKTKIRPYRLFRTRIIPLEIQPHAFKAILANWLNEPFWIDFSRIPANIAGKITRVSRLFAKVNSGAHSTRELVFLDWEYGGEMNSGDCA